MNLPAASPEIAAERLTKTVCVVVVTYNRLKLVQEVLGSLRRQTRAADKILVVNNASTDGTTEWLAEQTDLQVINQDNCGGAGGFYTGMKAAFEQGFDWQWCMDDDVVADEHCLERLLAFAEQLGRSAILCPLRFTPEGKPRGDERLRLNYDNPFIDHGTVRLHSLISGETVPGTHTKVEGFTFEGPLIPSEVIATVGLPDRNLFISADDTDLSVKCLKHFDCYVVHDAVMHRKLTEGPPTGVTWKDYYYIRNTITLDRRYGTLPVKVLRPLVRSLRFLSNRYVHNRCKDYRVGLGWVTKALVHGYLGILGRQH